MNHYKERNMFGKRLNEETYDGECFSQKAVMKEHQNKMCVLPQMRDKTPIPMQKRKHLDKVSKHEKSNTVHQKVNHI